MLNRNEVLFLTEPDYNEEGEEDYQSRYDRIEAQIIKEEIADGADEDYKPKFARVHSLVMQEISSNR